MEIEKTNLLDARNDTLEHPEREKRGWFSRLGSEVMSFGKRLAGHGVDMARGTVELAISGAELAKNFVISPIETTKAVGGAISSGIADACSYVSSPSQVMNDAWGYVQNNSIGEICADAVWTLGPAKLLKGLRSVTATAKLAGMEAKAAGAAARGSIFNSGKVVSTGAENINASANLKNKLSLLEKYQKEAVEVRTLSDGRIRYYGIERPASTVGPLVVQAML